LGTAVEEWGAVSQTRCRRPHRQMWLRLPYPASAGEGVPYEWRHMIKTCSQVRLPASLRHLGGEGGSGDAAEEGKEKLLPPPPLGLDPTKASVT